MSPDFKPENMLVRGKKALVTGGATGIGRAIAVALARCGADVAVTYNSHQPDDVGAMVEAAGQRFAAHQVDFSSLEPKGATEVTGSVCDALGGLDILVNNAGIIHREKAVDVQLEDWRRVLQVNMDATFYMSQAAGRVMVASGHGSVINIASILSFQGGLGVHAYTASKHALVGLTQSLCNEWAGGGVTVNAIAPGYTATDNTQALRDDPKRSSELLARIPAGRWAEPDDIAGAAVFLASDAARYVNGHTLVVDGGWLAR